MKAAYFHGVGDIQIEECGIPEIGEHEILLKVKACAVCGTDIRIFNYGHFKIPQGEKRVLGHEIAGEIARAGAGVKGYTPGMRVAVVPNVGCGACPECSKGLNQLCADYEAFGISWDGGFQQYMRIPEKAVHAGVVVAIPQNLSFAEAALVEPFSCCYNAYDAVRTRPGDTVLVVGVGPIGNMHIMINRLAGATKVIAADVNDERLRSAGEAGADVLINSAKDDLLTAVKAATGGRGADVVITACSVPAMQPLALELAAIGGRINFFGGMPKGKEQVTLNTNLLHYKEMIALGTTGSSVLDYHEALNIVASGKVSLKSLISDAFTIDKAREAFAYAASGKGMKVIIQDE